VSETILIITPTTVEFDAMSRRLSQRQEHHDDVITARGTIGASDVVVAMTGKGQESTSAAVTRLVDRTKARYVLLLALADGAGEGRDGDVVIPRSVLSTDCDLKLLQISTRLAEEVAARWKKAIVVPRPDGMRDDVTTAQLGNGLNEDAEARGAAAAIRLQQSTRAVGLLMVLGISAAPPWRGYAADAAAAFAATLLETLQPAVNASIATEELKAAPEPAPRAEGRNYWWVPIGAAAVTAAATITVAFINKSKVESPSTGTVVTQTVTDTGGTAAPKVDPKEDSGEGTKKSKKPIKYNESAIIPDPHLNEKSPEPIVPTQTSMLENLPVISGDDGPWAVVIFSGPQDRRDDVSSWVRDALGGSGHDTISLFRKVSDEQRVAPELFRGSKTRYAELNAGRHCSRLLLAKFSVATVGSFDGLITAEAKIAVHMMSPDGDLLKSFDISERGGGTNDESAHRNAIESLKEIVLRDLPSAI
jgi:hypothetical protein